MQPNIYSGIAAALLLLPLMSRERVAWYWRFFVICQVFGATSAANLTALGGASLVFTQLGVAVLCVTAFFAVGPADREALFRSTQAHWLALALIVYTDAISFLGPRMFADQMYVFPMRSNVEEGAGYAEPLGPTSSNITHIAYMTGTFITPLAVSILFARRLPAGEFRNAILAAGALHAILAVVDLMGLLATGTRVLEFLRNANYEMHDQNINGIFRLSGSLAEPAMYATFATPYAVFAVEEWLRQRRPAAGVIGLFLWICILASTSSTGIVAFVAYGLVFVPRFIFAKNSLARLLSGGLVVAALALLIAFIGFTNPRLLKAWVDFFLLLTVNKVDSDSAIERGSWVAQSWDALWVSHGVGVGAGSFRSSSLVASVFGSMGFIGAGLMAAYICVVAYAAFRPSRDHKATERSAGWAALIALVPSITSGASPDPGFAFAMFAGFALRPALPPLPRRAGGRRRDAIEGLRAADAAAAGLAPYSPDRPPPRAT